MNDSAIRPAVFVSGGPGYLGRPLIESLLARGHAVIALAREQSRGKIPAGAQLVVGDALDAQTFRSAVPARAVVVHLVGAAHPGTGKSAQFVQIDLASLRASLSAAVSAGASHFVYVSVAQPAPVMRAYVRARAEGERRLRDSGLPGTILRPWYVLGPGHRWPYLLKLAYWLAERLPATRAAALRLGLVTHAQMVAALVRAVESPPCAVQVVDVAGIRAAYRRATTRAGTRDFRSL